MSWGHYASNMMGWFILGACIIVQGRRVFFLLVAWCVVIGGFLLFLVGRDAIVGGLSGVLFGLFTFQASTLFVQRPINWKSIVFFVVSFALYGTMIWGIFPSDEHVSWEGHLCGAVAGVVFAIVYYKFRWFNRSEEGASLKAEEVAPGSFVERMKSKITSNAVGRKYEMNSLPEPVKKQAVKQGIETAKSTISSKV